MHVEHITSAENSLLKDIRRAQRRGSLTAQGLLIAEGPNLLQEVVRTSLPVRCAVIAEGFQLPDSLGAERTVMLSPSLFRSVSGTATPQGVLLLVEPPARDAATFFHGTPLVVILDGIQDPGNAGAIARSAEAFGASGLQFAEGSVDPFHPKAIRASAGSLLRVPLLPEKSPSLTGLKLFAGVPHPSAKRCWDCDWTKPCALVIGNEGAGVSARYLHDAVPVRIPTCGVESLNAAVAASLLLYEAARQRSTR